MRALLVLKMYHPSQAGHPVCEARDLFTREEAL
jgi:hypothetical protein